MTLDELNATAPAATAAEVRLVLKSLKWVRGEMLAQGRFCETVRPAQTFYESQAKQLTNAIDFWTARLGEFAGARPGISYMGTDLLTSTKAINRRESGM